MSQQHLIGLQCTETGKINYITRRKKKAEKPEKLQLKKYSPKLRKHTVHKEVKMKGFK